MNILIMIKHLKELLNVKAKKEEQKENAERIFEMEKEDFEKLVQDARKADLLDYFIKSGYKIEKHQDNYYVKDFPGLCIKQENNQWYHHYTNEGRTQNSIDCLTLVCGRTFKQAVMELTGQDIGNNSVGTYHQEKVQTKPVPDKPQKEKPELIMPEHSQNMRRLFAYFCQTRKIPPTVVEEFVKADLLYQTDSVVHSKVNGVEQTFKNSNAVFVHRNNKSDIIGGEIQGLNSFKRYKGVASGTGESVFMFSPVPAPDNKIHRAYIFESAIDLMSFYAFCSDKNKMSGAVLISMAGLKPAIPKRLAAEGVVVVSCVDNDDAGRKFESENGFFRTERVKELLDENNFKDWNELLVFKAEHPNMTLAEVHEQRAEKNKPVINNVSYARSM